MGNLALFKNATSSSFVSPYAPSRAVDGSLHPVQRWLCNSLPCWLCVDLGKEYWIDRWIVRHMPVAGWSLDYVLKNFKLQGSLDSGMWIDLDIVSNNTLAVTEREIIPVKIRWVRIYVTSGLAVNPQLASLVEFEVYEAPPTSPYLTNLTLSNGTLQPQFSKTYFTYEASVGYDIDKITLIPVAEDPNATIKVNEIVVPSGQTSLEIPLNFGNNLINVKVISAIGDLMQNYTVNVIRATSTYLTNLILKSKKPITINPLFDKMILSYTAAVQSLVTTVVVTPTAEDPNATIKVNGTIVQSGQDSQSINLNAGSTTINIEISPQTGIDLKTYTITVNK